MTSIRVALASILALLLCAPVAAAPLEAYGRLPVVEAVALSPDGTALATINTDGDQRLVAVRRLLDGKLISGVSAGDLKVRDIQWAGPQHLLITASRATNVVGLVRTFDEWPFLLVLDTKTQTLKRLMEDTGYREMRLNIAGAAEVRVIDGKPIAFVEGVAYIDYKPRLGLFRIDLATGRSELVGTGLEDTYAWLVDARGQPLAQAQYSLESRKWRLRVRRDKGWPIVKTLDAVAERPTVRGLGRDGESILVSLKEGGVSVFREISPVDGSWGEPFSPGEHLGTIVDGRTQALAGVSRLGGETMSYEFFDPKDQKVWNAVVKAFPGDFVNLVDWPKGEAKKMIVLVDSPTLGPAYAVVDLATGKSDFIGDLYKGLGAKDISPARAVRFNAADGLALTGYLTLPQGREAKGLPLVVLPHAGPLARNVPGFNWWAQALASRGYAVLAVNFRGSSGFGDHFVAAGFGEWGRKMQTDLSDGVRYLAGQGTIDPKRVCIVGSDYGGYAALAGATIDRGVYRCAASVGGPADLPKLKLPEAEKLGRTRFAFWTRFMGVETLNDPRLAAISPAAQASKADIPILLVHGQDDTVVPFEQSQFMADALKKAGKTVTLVPLKNEDHNLTRGETRREMLQAVVDFLEKNNPPT